MRKSEGGKKRLFLGKRSTTRKPFFSFLPRYIFLNLASIKTRYGSRLKAGKKEREAKRGRLKRESNKNGR